MPVFISHRTADDQIAKDVAARLAFHQVPFYLDDIDEELKRLKKESAITDLLVQRLNACTNLLAIVTANTGGSWWVPFEIGVAKQAPRAITTLTDQLDSALPEYLMQWPRLKGAGAIKTFIELYKQQHQVLNENVLRKQASASQQFSAVGKFEASLKAALGQS